MPSELLDMHRAFLAELEDRQRRLQEELDSLLPVTNYHRRAVEQLSARAQKNGQKSTKKATITDSRLLDMSRHHACELALHELGGKAKTQEVAEWLMQRGYGTEFDSERVFHNTCYTAMNRKPEVFEKTGPGEWRLLKRG
jgi:hypothetical protein